MNQRADGLRMLTGPNLSDEAAAQCKRKVLRTVSDIFPTSLAATDLQLDDLWLVPAEALGSKMALEGQARVRSSIIESLLPSTRRWAVDYDIGVRSFAFGELGSQGTGPLTVRTRRELIEAEPRGTDPGTITTRPLEANYV